MDKSRERLQTILSALQEETKSLLPAENVQELEVQLTIPKKRIEDLVSRLGQARNEIQEYEAELIQHQHRLEVVSEYRAIKKKDAPKQIVQPETLFSCPHCGYIFDEELFNMVRANYSAVNEEYLCQQIQFIISSTQKKLESVKSNYVELMSELKKEETAYQDSKDRFDVYIRQRGLRDSIRRFTNELGAVSADKAVIETEIKKIKRELRKMPSRKDTENKYIELVRSNIIPLADEQRPEYQPFRRNQNKFRSFIAVYLDHENDSRRIINITNDTIFCNGESFEPFSNAEYRAGNNLLEKISRIYLSNSSYSQTQGAQTRGTISNISITDNALPAKMVADCSID